MAQIMLDSAIRTTLMTEYEIGQETLGILDEQNISLNEDDFDIIKCAKAKIFYFDILKLIQYVFGMTMYSAQEMYAVVVYNKKPIEIINENEVKKKIVLI